MSGTCGAQHDQYHLSTRGTQCTGYTMGETVYPIGYASVHCTVDTHTCLIKC